MATRHNVLILGAGGHAQVVADALLRARDAGQPVNPIGYLDDNIALYRHAFLGLSVLGDIEALNRIPHDATIIAIGDNQIRKRLADALSAAGETFAIACHPAAVIAPDVLIAPGAMICAGVVVNTGSAVGAHVILNTGCTIDHHNRIGDYVHIAPGVHSGGDVHIGEGVLVGIGATVMPQRHIGAWSIVGAGALVAKDLPDQVVAVGSPARVIRRLNEGVAASNDCPPPGQ